MRLNEGWQVKKTPLKSEISQPLKSRKNRKKSKWSKKIKLTKYNLAKTNLLNL